MKWKTCNTCGTYLPFTLEYFHKDSSLKSGLRGECKECNNERVRNKYIHKIYTPPIGFKPLPYSNKYYVSKTGEIWSKKLGRLMSPYRHKIDGYLQLSINGICKKIHQLVLEAFRGMCPHGMEACHWDGNPRNNKLSNLYWGTRSDNVRDSVRHNTHPVVKLNKSKVINIKKMLRDGVRQSTIAKIYQVDQSTISYINTGKVWNYVHLDEQSQSS